MRGCSNHTPAGTRWVLSALLLALVTTMAPHAAAAPTPQATPSISVVDRELGWGDTTVVRGTAFRPSMAITISLVPGETVIGRGTTDGTGAFSISISVPSGIASSNRYQVVARGLTPEQLAFTGVTIVGPRPAVSLSDPELRWGETTRVSGVRFQAGSTVQVSLMPDTIRLATATVGGDGTFETSATIPDGLAASPAYQIVVTGTGSDGLYAYVPSNLTILSDQPFIRLSDDTVARGESLTITGFQFLRRTVVVLTLVPGFEPLGEATVGDDGSFSRTVRIPAEAAGSDPHIIFVTGQAADGQASAATEEIALGRGTPAQESAPTSSIPDVSTTRVTQPDAPRTTRASLASPEPVEVESSNALWIFLILAALAALFLLVATRKDARRSFRRQRRRLAKRLQRVRGRFSR